MPMRALLLLPAVLLSACGPNPDVTVVIRRMPLQDIYSWGPTNFTFEIRTDSSVEYCDTVSSAAQLLVNDQPLERLHRGGRVSYGRPGNLPTSQCTAPAGSGVAQPSADGIDKVLLRDGAERVAYAEADMFGQRRVELVSPADGVLKQGVEVVLQWYPLTDKIEYDPADLSFEALLPAVDFRAEGGWPSLSNFVDGPARLEGNRLRFRITQPVVVSPVLQGRLRIKPPGVRPPVFRCEGTRYKQCEVYVEIYEYFEVPATLGGDTLP